MIIDRAELELYPFDGVFYIIDIDKSLPPSEQEEKEIVILETKCDIQESKKTDVYGSVSASFNVYFPFDKKSNNNIRRGVFFKGSIYDMPVNGEVIGVFPTQMGGCACYIKDVDV